ncbi:hypothetical protein ALI22I_29575 [Saccharothrix sp. ALI-22-I]|uniref:hypothetical protein n=1 Tax=Saccharothrix sp. ALI-22-I TaxID=1933778 RepID=UPI00097CB2F4|nr:hypothetical protein [Saccharothrix sp. ALI-22-I]ONI84679.1 hypothetical protein ALI22I_29575 [Saccharothrix sp. ALI-22-I]
MRSFEQAKYALDLADRLGLAGRLHKAADLLVYQVPARADLVGEVPAPLRRARGGAGPLMDMPAAYFACGRGRPGFVLPGDDLSVVDHHGDGPGRPGRP